MPDDPSFFPLAIAGAAAGLFSASALWAYSVFAPRCQFWAPVLRSLPQRDAAALTFDDGPHDRSTPAILEHLARHNARATFFVIGQCAKRHPRLLRQIVDQGHTLGNHSFDHDHFGVNRNRAYWDAQLTDTQNLIADIAGTPPILFRPPMGFKTRHIPAAAAALKLPIIGWSVRAHDTRPIPAPELARRIVRKTTGHDILLLHDGIEPHRPPESSQQHTVDALPAILEGIRQKKLAIVPLIDALLAASHDMRQAAERTRARAAAS
jgi:peptidoglycan/xylan/chitin deacetylase (PgdA/CDA1 family)